VIGIAGLTKLTTDVAREISIAVVVAPALARRLLTVIGTIVLQAEGTVTVKMKAKIATAIASEIDIVSVSGIGIDNDAAVVGTHALAATVLKNLVARARR
jgi:hypothetical protein